MKRKLKLKNVRIAIDARGLDCYFCHFRGYNMKEEKAYCALFNHEPLEKQEGGWFKRCNKCIKGSPLNEIFK